jgi:hypothetical protein
MSYLRLFSFLLMAGSLVIGLFLSFMASNVSERILGHALLIFSAIIISGLLISAAIAERGKR